MYKIIYSIFNTINNAIKNIIINVINDIINNIKNNMIICNIENTKLDKIENVIIYNIKFKIKGNIKCKRYCFTKMQIN